MLISEIIPYEKNARHNEKAIPIVADSIAEFGLRGQIVLESKENPVIVAGHTRVSACKKLGWKEIPDENIAYCDGLTQEQIKAYRLADNRTGEIATWNQALLKSEIKDLKDVDMSRFSFDFKSKTKPYGAERFRTDNLYNLQIVNSSHCSGKYNMPTLKAIDFTPSSLVGFNYAKSASSFNAGIHFFVDDYQFERLWNTPEKYTELLSKFQCVLTPDFSLYLDMPLPLQQFNEYRRRALGNYWERQGLKVIPTLSWSVKRSFDFCFSSLPKNSTYAISTVGVKNSEVSMKYWFDGMTEAVKRLTPKRILLYGGDIGFKFDCEVVEYEVNTAFKDK